MTMETPRPPKKILIVDDDQNLLSTYAAKFKEEGFDVKTARDGEEAWGILQAGYVPDVMFTGILMPKMSGFDLIKKMQADPRFAPIPVAISSHRGRVEDKAAAKALGVDDFLTQGLVTLNEVVRRMKLLLGVQKTYTIEPQLRSYDGEALVNFLDKQQLTSIGSQKNVKLTLEMEPLPEKGTFKVELVGREEIS